VYEVWGPPDHSAYDSDHREPSVNTRYDPEHRSTSDQSERYTLENYRDSQVERATPDTRSARRRSTRPTDSNTRRGPGSVNSAQLPNPFSDYSSVLGDIANLTEEHRFELLSTLPQSELASLQNSISSAVQAQTTIIIPEHGKMRFCGVRDRTEQAVARLVGDELATRKWGIQELDPEDFFQYQLQGRTLDGDKRHQRYSWLVIPSEFKLKAYELGLNGLTQAKKEKEMELAERLAYEYLTRRPVHRTINCDCARFQAPSSLTRHSYCSVSQS